MTAAQVVHEVLRDRSFFDEAEGGVTLSGGEPLMQAAFTLEVLRRCREESLHTALDTCGHADRDALLACVPFVGVFLYDLKALDDDVHRRHTGVSNALILENLVALSRVHDNIWIRVPMIPGVNDEPGLLHEMARFVHTLSGVRQVNLLPYHSLGSHKRRGGRFPPVSVAATDCTGSVEIAATIFRNAGFPTIIGG